VEGEILQDGYEDGPEVSWRVELGEDQLQPGWDIITFDEGGVSGHPNHIDIYKGMLLRWGANAGNGNGFWKLKTLPVYSKYTGPLSLKYIGPLIGPVEQPIGASIGPVFTKISCFKLSCWEWLTWALPAMGKVYPSQMVWFRYAYIAASSYLHYNILLRVSKLADDEPSIEERSVANGTNPSLGTTACAK
jgi:N-acetylglucosaminylphosphatidylinositol deacetylase